MKLPNHVSESVKKLNPNVFALGGLATPEREPSQTPALDQKPIARKSRKGSVALRVSIIACRHRLLDDDNGVAGCKPLRDAIARHFGLDDDDARIRFEYGQLRTDGAEGTIVKLELTALAHGPFTL